MPPECDGPGVIERHGPDEHIGRASQRRDDPPVPQESPQSSPVEPCVESDLPLVVEVSKLKLIEDSAGIGDEDRRVDAVADEEAILSAVEAGGIDHVADVVDG